MQIASSGNSTLSQPIQSVKAIIPEPKPDLNDIMTPEQKNTVQQGADDKISEQVENVKANYQTAKDVDLMQSYYQQQQKLFDIYTQTSTDSNSTSSSTQTSDNTSAVSALTNTYAELYQLHQSVKEGASTLPSIDQYSGIEKLTEDAQNTTNNNVVNLPTNNMNSALSNKQLDSYNSLMMPSTSNYVHLSA